MKFFTDSTKNIIAANKAAPPIANIIGKQLIGSIFVQAISVPHQIDEKEATQIIKYIIAFFILFMFTLNLPSQRPQFFQCDIRLIFVWCLTMPFKFLFKFSDTFAWNGTRNNN